MLATIALAALLQLPGPQAPASPGEFVPGTTYDPAIPTLESVVGHEVWEVVTPPDQVVRYFEALAEAAADRTHLIHYADSWEGRPLVMMVIGSPERIASLDEVKARLAQLAYPDGLSDAEAEELIAGLPVVTALMHGVHGNEISSSGAAMMEAYHLLAARNDPNVDLIFAESLVLIDRWRTRTGATASFRKTPWRRPSGPTAKHIRRSTTSAGRGGGSTTTSST